MKKHTKLSIKFLKYGLIQNPVSPFNDWKNNIYLIFLISIALLTTQVNSNNFCVKNNDVLNQLLDVAMRLGSKVIWCRSLNF